MNPSGVQDTTERERWLADLRAQLLRVAARRVDADTAQDVVQEAMTIATIKAPDLAPGVLVNGRPAVAWCFRVLRNVLGNHYQKAAHRRHAPLDEVDVQAPQPDPLAHLETTDRRRLVDAALARLEEDRPDCGRYLARVRAGASPAEIAAVAGVEPAVLHRRLYRCRARLRDILLEMGAEP